MRELPCSSMREQHSGRGNGSCKGPGVEWHLACSRNRAKASVAEAERVRETESEREGGPSPIRPFWPLCLLI